MAGLFERLNETTGLMKAGNFLTRSEFMELVKYLCHSDCLFELDKNPFLDE